MAIHVSTGSTLTANIHDSQIAGTSRWLDGGGNSTIDLHGNTLATRPVIVDFQGGGEKRVDVEGSTLRRGLRITTQQASMESRLSAGARVEQRLVTSVRNGDSSLHIEDDSVVRGSVIRRTVNGSSTLEMASTSSVTRVLRNQVQQGTSHVRLSGDAYVRRYVGSGVESQRNQIYASRGAGSLVADVYTPKTEGPHPAILAIHGGYWRFGSKQAMAGRARQLADRGYVVVAINYRLAPQSVFPAQIHDVKSAITWMRSNASELQIDPDQIGTYGYSAGGHLALLLGMTDGSEGLEGPDATPGIDTRVQAVVAGGPAVDFRDFADNDDRLAYFLGGTPAEVPGNYADASPAQWVSSDDPPTMVFIGENDSVVSRSKVDDFVDQLGQAGVPHRFREVAGKGHLPAAFDRDTLRSSANFFDDTLKA